MQLRQGTFNAKKRGPIVSDASGKFEAKWYHVDAADQVVGRLATVIAKTITGQHRPTWTPHIDQGDFVVVTNASKVVFTRNKWEQKKYYAHTGYIGGLKETTAKEMLERKPEEILKKAVWGMTDKSSLARQQMRKLKIFAGSEHEHAPQKPEPLPGAITWRTSLKKN